MCKFRYYDNYDVYPDGRIWSYRKKKFLKPKTNKNGYQVVLLYDNEGNRKMYYLHRVVYEAVTSSPIPSNMEINHRSEDKTSNMITNLELVSHKQNLNYGTRNLRASKTKTNGVRSKQVGAFKNGELVMTFPSTAECGRQGFNQSAVAACCRCVKNYKTHKGYEWRYL